MARGWQEDKDRSDQFLPEIKRHLGEHLIGEPPREEDAERNTDLIVLRMEAVRIACRVRDKDYMARFGNEFTIRAGRPSGAKTELTKVIEGWGDYFFYGFGDYQSGRLLAWKLGCLKAFRLGFNRALYTNGGSDWLKPRMKDNKDGSSDFAVFCWEDFPEMVIAESAPSRRDVVIPFQRPAPLTDQPNLLDTGEPLT